MWTIRSFLKSNLSLKVQKIPIKSNFWNHNQNLKKKRGLGERRNCSSVLCLPKYLFSPYLHSFAFRTSFLITSLNHVYIFCFRYRVDLSENVDWRATCKHKQGSAYKCYELTAEDVQQFRSCLFKTAVKIDQDTVLIKYVQITKASRIRNASTREFNRPIACCYYIEEKSTGKKRKVCHATFLHAIAPIKRNRLVGIKRSHGSGLPKEGRGGDRISHKSVAKKDSVKTFISSLKRKSLQ